MISSLLKEDNACWKTKELKDKANKLKELEKGFWEDQKLLVRNVESDNLMAAIRDNQIIKEELDNITKIYSGKSLMTSSPWRYD